MNLYPIGVASKIDQIALAAIDWTVAQIDKDPVVADAAYDEMDEFQNELASNGALAQETCHQIVDVARTAACVAVCKELGLTCLDEVVQDYQYACVAHHKMLSPALWEKTLDLFITGPQIAINWAHKHPGVPFDSLLAPSVTGSSSGYLHGQPAPVGNKSDAGFLDGSYGGCAGPSTSSSPAKVSGAQVGNGVNITMKNTADNHSIRFSITFSGCTNVVFPEGNPYVLTLGPGEESTTLLCKRSDQGAAWRWKWRWTSKSVYVEQPENPEAFTDIHFPANMSSIGESSSRFYCATSVDRWVRASGLGAPGKAVLFQGIDPNDVRQGAVGDCWLMAAMSEMARNPSALKALFGSHEVSGIGSYDVRLFDIEAMDWVTITIDDLIPCKVKNGIPVPLFAKPDGEEIWVLLLEKAFAKFCGSYGQLSGGSPSFAFQIMTGETRCTKFQKMADATWRRQRMNRTKQIEKGARNPRNFYWNWKTDDLFDNDALWEKLTSSENHPKACLIDGDAAGAEAAGKAGLFTRHVYSFLRTASASLADGSKERLVQLRNPWGGAKEWTGDWSDGSSKWDQNPDVAFAIGYAANADGEFWMSWQDWTSNFTSVQVCPKDMVSGELQGEDHDDDDHDECVQEEVHG